MATVEKTPTSSSAKSRIESLSDLIFGLALSVGAVTLVSNINSITTEIQLRNDIVVFAFSFLILISVWLRYTRVMSVLSIENRYTMALNTALLFTVSLEPFLFNVLQQGSLDKNIASQYYAADLGLMMSILGGFTYALVKEQKLAGTNVQELRIESVNMLIAGLLFFISILSVFWQYSFGMLNYRFILWIIPFALASVRRRTIHTLNRIRERRTKRHLSSTNSHS